MLTFKQFLSEDMPYLEDDFSETEEDKAFRTTDLRQRIKYINSRKGNSQFTKIGNIGPYEVNHVPSEFTGSVGTVYRTHHIVVTHRKKPIGAINFSEDTPKSLGNIDIPTHVVAQGPIFDIQHSGKKGRVSALPSRVYQMVASHLKMPIVSGSLQSRGGQNVWANLAKFAKVSAINTRSGEHIANYNPNNAEHVKTAYPPTDRGQQAGHYWNMVHFPNS